MLRIRGRRTWGAKPARVVVRTDWRNRHVKSVIHHTVTSDPGRSPARQREMMRHIQDYHMSIGWSDIGYNYVIMNDGRYQRTYHAGFHMVVGKDGKRRLRRRPKGWKLIPATVYVGRGMQRLGAHAPSMNTHPGIAFVGNYENMNMHPGQELALKLLERRLRDHGCKVVGRASHRSVYATSCPGKNIIKRLGL